MRSVRVEPPAAARPRPGAGLSAAVVLLVVVLLVVGALAGCARAVDVAGDPVAGVGAPAGQATAASATAPSAAGAADPVGRLRASLLAPADLGTGWSGGDPPVPDASTPAPCGGPGTVARFPDALRVGSTVVGPAGAVAQEALSVYGDVDTAQAAFRAGVAGLGCGQGTLHGAAVAIAPAQDLRPDVGGEQASGWQTRSDAVDAVLVLVQARQAVFTFAFITPAGSPARSDPRALTRVAVARALAA